MSTSIAFPAEVDGAAILRPLWHSAWRAAPDVGGSVYRREITRESPMRFALTYLPHYLRDQVSGGVSFSPLHLDMAAAAARWILPEPAREAWVAPRGAAKSTWQFLILPLWALAHGHRRFLLAFSLTAEQAEGHLANLRHEMVHNELLLADFPELTRRRGPGSTNTKRTVTASGATIAARGLGGAVLGIRSAADRPDLIIGDDLEPPYGHHTPQRKEQIEAALTSSILPMGARHAVVSINGTTTMRGSLIHDVVRAALPPGDREHRVAPWIAGHGFVVRHYPPILDEGTGRERSLWPQRWSLGELRAQQEQAPQDYARNMANRPEQDGVRGWWRPELFRYDPRIPVVRRVLYIDGAMSKGAQGRKVDQTALVMVGVDATGRRAVVEYAAAARGMHGEDIREQVWMLQAAHPQTLREVIAEGNQGGDRWREILSPIPFGVGLDVEHVRGSKASRLEVALKHYQRGAVWHAHKLPDLEFQACAWTPAATVDDLLDALAGALRRVFPAPTLA